MDRNFPRLLDTLAVLQRGAGLSTPQIRERLLARGHEVTLRTVQRDLEDLARHYPLECDRRVRPFAWRWRAGTAGIALPGMDWPQALAFQLMDTYLQGVMPASLQAQLQPHVDAARRKLDLQLGALPLRRWPQRVRLVHPGLQRAPAVAPAVHAAVTEAVLLGRQLAIRYQGVDSARARSHVVAPLGLVQHGPVFYLPVRFAGHDDVRTLALHRIRSAQVLDTPSGIEDFDLDAWLRTGPLGFGGLGTIHLVAVLHEELPDRLAEAPLSADQALRRRRDGSTELRATVLDSIALRRWLLGQGGRIEVRSPAALRRALGDELRAAAARYG